MKFLDGIKLKTSTRQLVLGLFLFALAVLCFAAFFNTNLVFSMVEKSFGRNLNSEKWIPFLKTILSGLSFLCLVSAFTAIFFKDIQTFYAEHNLSFYLIVISLTGLLCRLPGISFESVDYTNCLKPWYESFKADRFGAFRNNIGDYTNMYKYIIFLITFLPIKAVYAYKLLSILFDFILAASAGLLVYTLTDKNKFKASTAYSVIMLLPSIILNSSVWAQCDSIYTSFILISFYYLLKTGERNRSIIFFTIAFCFKLQAIFYLPVIIIAILKGRLKVKSLIFFPIVYILTNLPAICLGVSPFYALIGAYIKQITGYSSLCLNCPNLYAFLPAAFDDKGLSKIGTFMTFGLCVISAMVLTRDKKDSEKNWLLYAYAYLLVIPFLLPHMHERYFYLADCFAVITAFVFPCYAYIPLLSIAAVLPTQLGFLYGLNGSFNLLHATCIMLTAIALLFRALKKEMELKDI